VTQLYPQAMESLFVASYDSQGYGGGIRTRLHAGNSLVFVGRSLKFMLAFASTVIPGFSLLEIHGQDIYPLLDMCFEMGPPLRRGRGRCFCVGATFAAPQFQPEYIRAVTASRLLWSVCVLCHCTVLSNIYTRCDNLIPGMALWKQILLTCALAAAVALWSYALRETMAPLTETVLKLFSGIPRSNVMLRWMSRMSENLCPFRAFFHFGKSQKS
jgi:hypothetical protein